MGTPAAVICAVDDDAASLASLRRELGNRVS
jgi:hypothetical protein